MPTDHHDALPDDPRRSGVMPVPEDRPSGHVPVGYEHESDSGIGPATDVMYPEAGERRSQKRRTVDKELAAQSSATMGIVGSAKQLVNVAAVAVIAAICITLLVVVIGFAWLAVQKMFAQIEVNNATVKTIADQQQKSFDQAQRREDTIREALLQEQARQRESQAKFVAEFVAEMRALTAENRALTAEIRASRMSIERTERALTKPPE